jgi:hypothetical protein
MQAFAAGTPADTQAKKAIKSTMDKDYMAGDFDVAVQKLKLADAVCAKQGCSPAVRAQIQGSLATVHWVGMEDHEAASQDLLLLLSFDPKYRLGDEYASPELIAALEAIRPAPARHEPKPEPKAEPAAAEPDPEEAEETRKDDAFHKQIEARKAQYAREAEAAQRVAAAADARRVAEEKLAEEAHKVDEARKLAEEKQEAARKAAEERKEAAKKAIEDKKEAARKAAEEKKEAAKKAIEDKKKAAEEKKEAAKKAIEDKKEAERKAAEEKKAAARKAIEDKKIAARKAAEDAARKAADERQAKEDERLRTPPPVGKMQETPWREQTIGYPIPIYVKLPPPPQGIEKPRVEVVKVVTEYSGPGIASQQFELKALASGGYGGLLPCQASVHEGEVRYFTTALNKYDNPVARAGSIEKPNKIEVKGKFTGAFPHLPGELPPRVCSEGELGAKAAAPPCQSNSECPEGVCTKDGCSSGGGTAAAAATLPETAPRSGGCAALSGCKVGSSNSGTTGGAVGAIALFGVHLLRRRRRSRDTRAA